MSPGQDEEARRALRALELSEAKFSGIVSISSDAIITVDERQRILHFNRGAEQIFGYAAEEVIGQPLDVLLPERFRDVHRQHIRNFGDSPVHARRMGERQEIVGRRKSGQEFPAEASISKLDVGGEQLYTAVLRDVTERKRAEEEKERLYREAQEALRVRDEVLAVVGHELGNSLSAIRIGTGLLLRRLPADERETGGWQYLQSVRQTAEQMEQLINDLLDVKRLEAGHLRLERVPTEPGELIREAVGLLAPVAAEKSLVLESSAASSLPAVHADRARVLQVLGNLIGNAIKFTPPGGRISVGATADGNDVVFSVADTGPGIPEEELPSIFDRFWRGERARHHGAGLGLAISKGIVESHDGRIWAESRAGHGATLRFSLSTSAHQQPT